MNPNAKLIVVFNSSLQMYLVATDVAARGIHVDDVSLQPGGVPYIAPVVEKPSFGGRRPRPNSDQRRRRPR